MADTIRIDASHNVLNTNSRHTIGRFLTNLRKFAIDSAINVSVKGFTGGKKLYQIFLQERFKDERTRRKFEDDKLKEKMQLAKMEDMNDGVKLQSKTETSKPVGGSEHKKKMPQGLKELDLQEPNRKRIFIRSRL
ncbi:hypothetical protein PTKIN_Ptkin11bG0158100 [Pterospermum kingtungense]